MFAASAPLAALVEGLRSPRSVIRSAAADALLTRSWRESAQKPGLGLITADATAAAPLLISFLGTDSVEARRAAVLLSLFAEAEGDAGVTAAQLDATRAAIAAGVPVFLAGLARAAQAVDASSYSHDPEIQAWVYLLAHFVDRQDAIVPAAQSALGEQSRPFEILVMLLRLSAARPRRAKSVLMYLGAEAGASAFDRRHWRASSALGCPSCHGELRFGGESIDCASCAAPYRYAGDTLDLVAAGDETVDEFPEEVVDGYETQSRPRFVHVMGNDWSGPIPPEREARFIEDHLTTMEGPVVDLGCGAGSRTAMVARAAGASRVIAVDYSSAMLAACGRSNPHVLPVRGNASALPIRSGTLGGVNCSDALQAFPDPARALSEIARVLKPGAPFVCFTFTEAAAPYQYFQHRFPSWPRTLWSREALRDAVIAAGFDLREFAPVHDAIFFAAIRRR